MGFDANETLAVFTVASWADGPEGDRLCAKALDDYIEAVGGSSADRFDALQKLLMEAERIIRNQSNSEFVLKAIKTRMAEITASMIAPGSAVLSSDLLKD